MQPLIRQLHFDLCASGNPRTYQERRAFDALLRSALDRLTGFADQFAALRSMATSPPTPGTHEGFVPTAVWTFYALGRVADVMLPFQDTDPLQTPEVNKANADDLLRLFLPLGMTTMPGRAFSPAFHEVVEAVEDSSLGSSVAIVEEVWPGLMFGAMVFLHAGVRVLCGRAVMLPEVAGRSRLYFTFWRRSRPTRDLSHGWGSQSQCGTEFRRDYAEGGMLHYNVDGTLILSSDGPPQPLPQAEKVPYRRCPRPVDPRPVETYDLTPAERIELLTNRCFVRTIKLTDDYWIFSDRYTEPDSAART